MAASEGTKKILVIDDMEAQLSLAKILLQDVYDVSLAKSGKEALEMLFAGFVPDLVLLDIMMPEMDGWETYNRIRAISFLEEAPIVFITSADGEEQRKHAADCGAADFIVKPLIRKDLISRIDAILSK